MFSIKKKNKQDNSNLDCMLFYCVVCYNQAVMGTFKYHMTLQGKGGFAQIVKSTVMWVEGVWPNRITFTVAEKV